MKYQTIYCDIDGVLADFHLEAVRAHMRAGKRFPKLDHSGTPLELTHDYLYDRWPLGLSCHQFCCEGMGPVPDYWSSAMDAFWAPIRLDPLFWHNVPHLPWWRDLVSLLRKHCEHLVWVTTPDKHRYSYGGKYHWLVQHKLDGCELITMHNKWRLAHPRSLLIDDFEKHTQAWGNQVDHLFREPGHVLLFPQPWNPNHHLIADRLGYVESYLKGNA